MDVNKALKGIGAWQAYRTLTKGDWSDDLREALLDRLGLERKSTMGPIVGGLGFFALGILVGSALGVILAPMPGSDMRATLKEQGVRGVVGKRSPMPTPSA